MANEEKGLKAGVVVYKKVDDMTEKEQKEQFKALNAVLTAKNSRKNKSTYYYKASVVLAPGIDLQIDLISSEYSLIFAERGVQDLYRNMDVKLPVFVRLVHGTTDLREYMYVEIRLCKDVVKQIFLDINQMKLIQIKPELIKGLVVVEKEGAADSTVEEQNNLFAQMFN